MKSHTHTARQIESIVLHNNFVDLTSAFQLQSQVTENRFHGKDTIQAGQITRQSHGIGINRRLTVNKRISLFGCHIEVLVVVRIRPTIGRDLRNRIEYKVTVQLGGHVITWTVIKNCSSSTICSRRVNGLLRIQAIRVIKIVNHYLVAGLPFELITIVEIDVCFTINFFLESRYIKWQAFHCLVFLARGEQQGKRTRK